MATRLPRRLITAQLSGTATTYTVPAASKVTFSAATLNNSTGTARTVTATVTPSGGSAYEILSALPVPVSGSAPTTVPALVGHTLEAGDVLSVTADAGSAVTFLLSGYLQT